MGSTGMLSKTSVFQVADPNLATSHSVGGKKPQDAKRQTIPVQKELLSSGITCFIKFLFKTSSNLYFQCKNEDSNKKTGTTE